LGKVVHTVKRAGTYAAKVSHKELRKIAVHVRAVGSLMEPDPDPYYLTKIQRFGKFNISSYNKYLAIFLDVQIR
jgi:hypothetical protein